MVVENQLQVGYSMPNHAGFNSQLLMVTSLYLNTTAPPITKAGYGPGNKNILLIVSYLSRVKSQTKEEAYFFQKLLLFRFQFLLLFVHIACEWVPYLPSLHKKDKNTL